MRRIGCIANKVEYWNSYAKKSIDLFKVFDIVAVSPNGDIEFIQVTTQGEIGRRAEKIFDTDPELMERLSKNPHCMVSVWGWSGVKKTISNKGFFMVWQWCLGTKRRYRIFTDGNIEVISQD